MKTYHLLALAAAAVLSHSPAHGKASGLTLNLTCPYPRGDYNTGYIIRHLKLEVDEHGKFYIQSNADATYESYYSQSLTFETAINMMSGGKKILATASYKWPSDLKRGDLSDNAYAYCLNDTNLENFDVQLSNTTYLTDPGLHRVKITITWPPSGPVAGIVTEDGNPAITPYVYKTQ